MDFCTNYSTESILNLVRLTRNHGRFIPKPTPDPCPSDADWLVSTAEGFVTSQPSR
jgi:hypothetical protein